MSGATPIMAPGLATPVSHYAHAVAANGLLFISGLLGTDAQNQLAAADAGGQAECIFNNLKLVLAAAGATLDDVAKLTIFLLDIGDRAAVDAARRAAFGLHRPASTLIAVSAFVIPGAIVEIEAVAALPRN